MGGCYIKASNPTFSPNPKPETPNPKPETPHPKPEIRIPKPISVEASGTQGSVFRAVISWKPGPLDS